VNALLDYLLQPQNAAIVVVDGRATGYDAYGISTQLGGNWSRAIAALVSDGTTWLKLANGDDVLILRSNNGGGCLLLEPILEPMMAGV
jgi:hypothetical protein